MSRTSKCFVPGCNTGYNSVRNKKKLSLFKPPAHKLLVWNNAILRLDKTLTVNDRVCELHFPTQFIIREDTFNIGTEIVTLKRIRPKLHPDAVPVLFPSIPICLSKEIKPPQCLLQKHTHHNFQASSSRTLQTSCITDVHLSAEPVTSVTLTELHSQHMSICNECPLSWTSNVGD